MNAAGQSTKREEALREEFLREAGLHGDGRRCKREQALSRAWRVRDFEIELYWKRSLYFWGFQVAFLAGAGVSISLLNGAARELEPFFLVFGFILSLLGCISATLWAALERGSKDWQDNWERQIDLLEDEFTGAIYKTYVVPEEKRGKSFSISKLNSWMTLATAGFWCAALVIIVFGLAARYQVLPYFAGVKSGALLVCLFLLWLRWWAGIEWSLTSGWSAGSGEPARQYKVQRRNICNSASE